MIAEYRSERPIRVTREDGFEAWFRPDWSFGATLRRARAQFGQPLPDPQSARDRLLNGLIGARRLVRNLFREHFTCDIWAVGYCFHRLRSLGQLRTLEWTWRPEPAPLTYEADPFAYRDQEGWHLLVERHRHGSPAQIVEIDDRGHHVRLAGRHHSYPYLFRYQGQLFCLPESVADRALRLYRVDRGLHYHSTLLEGVEAADPVLFEHHGRWWLLYTRPSLHGAYRLHALYADSPLGPFSRHALDPLKQDIRWARNGGKPFRLEGQLYRPTQVCSQTYGQALMIQRVEELTPTSFGEVPVMRLDPRPPYPDGLHHLVVEDDLVLIDGKRVMTDLLLPTRR